MREINWTIEMIKIAEQAVAETPVDEVKGIVGYVDGGARPNPGSAGFGVHGYLFTTIKSKRGTGNPDHVLTINGYMPSSDYKLAVANGMVFPEEEKASDTLAKWLSYPQRHTKSEERNGNAKKLFPFVVSPVQYFDGFGSFATPETNNFAELTGAIQLLQLSTELDVNVVVALCDSRYVVDAINEWLPAWRKRNFMKPDGSEISNRAAWIKLSGLLDQLVAKGIAVNFDWVKGHNDNLGNEKADALATLAVMHSMDRQAISRFDYSPAEGYWKYDTDRHPMINHQQMFFNTSDDYCVEGIYYLGEQGKDEAQHGTRNSNGSYSVVRLQEPDLALELLRKRINVISKDALSIVRARLGAIFRPETYRQLMTYGGISLEQPKSNRLDFFALDREPVVTEYNPPKLAMRMVEEVSFLEKVLDRFLSNDPTLIKTDLTDVLYETEVKVVKKESISELKLKPIYNVGFSKMEIDANYSLSGVASAIPVILSLGIDLPDRNALKRLEKLKPNVTLISWEESTSVFRYATVIVCSNGVGIWAGTYSNIRFVPLE